MHDDDTDVDGRISTLFHDTAAQVEPDVPSLVRRSIDRGRVKLRWRNLGTAFAAAAAVALVGVATSVVPSIGLGGAGFGPATAPGGDATTSTVPRPTAIQPTKHRHQPTVRTKHLPVKAADLSRLFTQLYPGKVTVAEKRTGRIIDDGRAGQYAHFLWNGFMTSVGFTAYSGTPAQGCKEVQQDASRSNAPTVTCLTRSDGTVLMRGSEVADHDGGGISVNHHAVLFTKDGYMISVISYNWASKTEPTLAEEPPLSIAQLTRAVTSDTWS